MSLVELPLHLLVDILQYLPDIQSLVAAKATHSALHYAFKEKCHCILNAIIMNQIPTALLGFAQAAHSSRRKPFSFDHVLDTIEELYLDCESSDYDPLVSKRFGPLNLPKAIEVDRMHRIVGHFTDRIEIEMLERVPEEFNIPECLRRASLSSTERFMIHRALYRFELYCGLFFGDGHGFDDDDKRRSKIKSLTGHSFLGHSAPWVNEQLACIHDYLEMFLSEAFDLVAAHDVEWGANRIEWIYNRADNEWKQALLSYGLQFLYELDHEKDYDKRRGILTAKQFPTTTHMLARYLPRCHLVLGVYDIGMSEVKYWGMEQFEQQLHTQPDEMRHAVDKLDRFPFEIWRRAHINIAVKDTVFHTDMMYLRKCGYVLWDLPVEAVADLSKCVHRLKKAARTHGDYVRRAEKVVLNSFQERREIFDKGGRGFWTPGDTSRIVWQEQKQTDKIEGMEVPGLAELTVKGD